MDPRRLILRILTTDERNPGNIEGLVDSMLRNAALDRRDKGFVFEVVYGVVRRRLTLDYMIDRLLETVSLRKNHMLRRILRVGLYQILFMDRVPDYAAVNESVGLAKSEADTRPVAGVVNGVLRKVIADRRIVALPDAASDLVTRLSVEYSHPVWLVERWLKNLGLANTKKLLAFNNATPPTHLRRRIKGLSRTQFESQIRSLCDPATGYLNLYYRLNKNVLPEELMVVKQGFCNVQSPSSGWVVALLEPGKGDKILDLCAAPGGKAAMVSELIGDEGTLCACDSRWRRIRLCEETLRTMRCHNVFPLLCDGRHPPFEGEFDRVLLDAPCSATGVMHRHPDARWVRTPENLTILADVQRRLLDASARLVARGGTLVYATCSLEPEENRQQVESFLGEHSGFEQTACPESVPPIYVDDHGFLSITPHEHGMDGMFAVRLKRKR